MSGEKRTSGEAFSQIRQNRGNRRPAVPVSQGAEEPHNVDLAMGHGFPREFPSERTFHNFKLDNVVRFGKFVASILFY